MLHRSKQRFHPAGSYAFAFNTFNNRPYLKSRSVANVISNTYQLPSNNSDNENPKFFINNKVSKHEIQISSYQSTITCLTNSQDLRMHLALMWAQNRIKILFNSLNSVRASNHGSRHSISEKTTGEQLQRQRWKPREQMRTSERFMMCIDWERVTIDYSNWLASELPHTGPKLDGPTWPEGREDTKGQEVSFRVRAYGAIKMMISTDGTFREPIKAIRAGRTTRCAHDHHQPAQ